MAYRVVIADDDQLICRGITYLITQQIPDLKITEVFYSGTDLYEYLEKNTVDIVIADIQMSGCTGLEIAEFVKKSSPKTLVLLITGHRVFDYAVKAINVKVDAFLTKPYHSKDLLEKLNEFCTILANQSSDNSPEKEESFAGYIAFSIEYISEHYQDNSLSLSHIANLLHINSDYLGRLFKEQTGTSYSQYLSNYRMEKAANLLLTTNKSVATIGSLVGYNQVSYFRKMFKGHFNCTPYAYRKANTNLR